MRFVFLAKKEHRSQLDVAVHLLDHQNPIHHLKECGVAKCGMWMVYMLYSTGKSLLSVLHHESTPKGLRGSGTQKA